MTNYTTNHSEIPIACDLTALPAGVREQHLAEGIKILQKAVEVQELPDGYRFRFANAPGELLALARFVENEGLCCPFYAFVIEVEPGHGPLWLQMTGGEGVKEFEEAIFSDVSEALRQKVINSGENRTLENAVVQSSNALAEVLGKR